MADKKSDLEKKFIQLIKRLQEIRSAVNRLDNDLSLLYDELFLKEQ